MRARLTRIRSRSPIRAPTRSRATPPTIPTAAPAAAAPTARCRPLRDAAASTATSAQARSGTISDAAGGSDSASLAVTVTNVAPSIAISGNANVNEGSAYTLTLGAVTDPGADTVSSYVVHWGDSSSDTYGSNGAKTHTYADGDTNPAITVDLTDEDG